MTEQQTEALLEQDTRILTMPDGKKIPVRGFKLMWNAFDLLLEANMFTEDKLIELAYSWSQREGLSFDEALKNLVGFIHVQVKRL